jgi:hypothetical protein
MTTERPHDRHEEEPIRGPGEAPRSQPEAEASGFSYGLRLSLKGGDAAGVVMQVAGSVSAGPLRAAVWLCGALFQAPVVASWWR